jgi:hypothetical protein
MPSIITWKMIKICIPVDCLMPIKIIVEGEETMEEDQP